MLSTLSRKHLTLPLSSPIRFLILNSNPSPSLSTHLSYNKYLGIRKILKVLMIYNNIDGIGRTFQIVLPNLESFKDGKQFLVMCVVVQLHRSESVGVKGN